MLFTVLIQYLDSSPLSDNQHPESVCFHERVDSFVLVFGEPKEAQMQPPCSLQLGPCGPSPSLGMQRITGGFQRLEEKQLFEKFWKGTFKAVATPRPESVIVASITARRRVTK